MKTFFLVVLLVLTTNTISFAIANLELNYPQNKSDTFFLKNQCFVQESPKIMMSGFNFYSSSGNISNRNFYQRYRIHFFTFSLILIGVFFGVFYPRMTQPPIKK